MLKSYLKTLILLFLCIELGQTAGDQISRLTDDAKVKPPADEERDLKVVVIRLKEDLEKTQVDMMKLIQDLQTKINTMEGSLKTMEENVVHLQTKINTMEGSFNTMEEDCGQECLEGSHNCSQNATCIDTCGHYKCSCLDGYSGDGFICEVAGCSSPSQEIPGLGCVIPVKEELSWDDAQLNCQQIGARLVEGITRDHLELLQQHFNHAVPGDYVHVGLRGGIWVTSKDPLLDPQGDLWGVEEPDGTDQHQDNCAVVFLPSEPPSFYDYTCDYTFSSLCQTL